MEVLYELLWKACSWFLLSFLVERLISLLVWLNNDDSICGSIKEKGIKRSSIVDHDYEQDFATGVCVSDSKKKRVEFDDDQATEFVKDGIFRDIGLSLSSSEFNLVDLSEKEKSVLEVGFNQDLIKGFEEKERIINNEEETGEFGKDLVDKIEKEEKIVGFEDKFGGKLESGKINAIDHIKEAIEGLKDRVCHEIGVVLESEKNVDDERKGQNSSNVHKGEISGREFSIDEGVLSDDEEWEGIERSELEKKFAKAMNLVGCKDNEGQLMKGGNDLMMQLYGLQKVAMEGPCHEPQPMALKLSARAKWNAWQRLGNMTREDAMEQYVNLLSDNSFEGVEDANSSVESKSSSSKTAVDSYPEAS